MFAKHIPSDVNIVNAIASNERNYPKDPTERDKSKYRYFLKYYTSALLFDEHTYKGQSEYILLEGLPANHLRKVLNTNKYMNIYPAPTMVRRNLSTELNSDKADDTDTEPNGENLPLAIYVIISYSTVEENHKSMKQQLLSVTPPVCVLVFHSSGSTASLDENNPFSRSLIESVKTFLRNQYGLLNEFQKTDLAVLSGIDVFPAFKRVPKIKVITDLDDAPDNFYDSTYVKEYLDKCPSKINFGKFMYKYPSMKTNYNEADDLAKWKSLVITGLETVDTPHGEEGVLSVLKLLDLEGQTNRIAEYLFSLTKYEKIRKHKLIEGRWALGKNINRLERDLFGIGIKEKKAENPKESTYDFKRNTSKPNPAVNELIERLTQKGKCKFPIDLTSKMYNSLDEYSYKMSCNSVKIISKMETNAVIYLMDFYNQALVSVCNNFDGIDCNTIKIDGKTHGFFIKGPGHPRKDSDKVPFVILQLIQTSEVTLWKKLTSKRVFFTTKLDNVSAVAWRANVQKSECQHLGGISRVWLHYTTLLYEEFFRNMEIFVKENDEVDVLVEDKLSDYLDCTGKSDLYIKKRRERLAIMLCITLTSDIQTEGFLANTRRLMHQAHAAWNGRQVYRRFGADPEKKASDCCIDNIMTLFLVTEYNQYIEDINNKVSSDGGVKEIVDKFNLYLEANRGKGFYSP